MKKRMMKLLAVFLACLMLLGSSRELAASAAEELDRALNPAEQIELIVPASLQDGGNWFFIREESFTAGEKSGEKLYIPIQRTGNVEAEADVTLKVIDMSAHYGVNCGMTGTLSTR